MTPYSVVEVYGDLGGRFCLSSGLLELPPSAESKQKIIKKQADS